jgi:hypothetical protein
MGKGGMSEMALKEEWDRLDSDTRQWLLANPGCVLVPRTVTARIKTGVRQAHRSRRPRPDDAFP